jgi:predicted component of type VI protein secretion system
MQGVQSGVTNSELRLRVHGECAARAFVFPSSATVWLGRDATCDIVLDSQEVSRRHASLFVKEGELFVRDHSTYGTRLNGQPVQRAVRGVVPPAVLELGPYRVEVTLASGVLGVRLLADAPARLSARLGLRTAGLALLSALALAFGLRAGSGQQVAPPLARGVAVQRPCPPPPATASIVASLSVPQAVQLLRAGDRVGAFRAYRALAAADDSRAELSIVAQLLARELACRP